MLSAILNVASNVWAVIFGGRRGMFAIGHGDARSAPQEAWMQHIYAGRLAGGVWHYTLGSLGPCMRVRRFGSGHGSPSDVLACPMLDIVTVLEG
jgi:hypothetical protein